MDIYYLTVLASYRWRYTHLCQILQSFISGAERIFKKVTKLHNTKAKRASAGNTSSAYSTASCSTLLSASTSTTPTLVSPSVTSSATTVVSSSGPISHTGSSSSSVSNTSSTSYIPKVTSTGISATISSEKLSVNRPNRQTDSSGNTYIKLSSSEKSVETESESLDKKFPRTADNTPALSEITEKPDGLSAKSAKDKGLNRSVKSTVELNKTASNDRDSRAPVSTGEQSSDVIVSVVENARRMPPSGIKRHKRGRKGALDTPETPITEVVLVVPPEGVEIVNYQTRVKKSKKTGGKYASIDQNEELITDDLDRDFFYEVHRSETKQFYTEGVKVPVKDEKKDCKQPQSFGRKANTLSASQKRKFEVLNKAVKDTDMPVKKPRLYTINPFCLPVALIDLDS